MISGRAQPNDYLPGHLVYLTHHAYLMSFFVVLLLVGADSIDPDLIASPDPIAESKLCQKRV